VTNPVVDGMPDRPNVLLLHTDQHRGDCIGADPNCPTDAEGDPLVHTPNIDHFVADGALFSRAYTPAPSCVPARRCLWTGQTPASCGATVGGSHESWDFAHPLPGELRGAGYQTHLAGKCHSFPQRNRIGFEGLDLHSGLDATERQGDDDYANWLAKQGNGEFDEISHGVGRNSWDARPFHLPEHLHPTNWTTNRALEFLEGRDPTRPFFLTVSYVRPHQPFDPPQPYWDMYADRELPEPYVGDWVAEIHGDEIPTHPAPWSSVADLPAAATSRARTGYYGSVTHIDHQIQRIGWWLRKRDLWEETLVVFTADHGELLGDHHLWAKGAGFEGSSRVPLVVNGSDSTEFDREQIVDRPVGLEDVMPTVLEAAGVPIPDSVEGRSLFALLEDGEDDWRRYYHGEHDPAMYDDHAVQYIVDESMKFIWNPLTGDELLFDLEADPGETTNLADDPDHAGELVAYRDRLIDRLEGRPEGFSDGEQLYTRTADAWE